MDNKQLIIGGAISIILLYLLMWKPDIGGLFHGEQNLISALFGNTRMDFTLIWKTFSQIQLVPLLIGFMITPVHVFVRAHRWSILVRPVGKLKVLDSFSLQMVGYLANTILPFRMGELIRGVLLGRRIKISKSTSLATVVVERMIDSVSLLGVLAIIGFLFPFSDQFKDAAWIMVGGIAAVLGVILYFAFATDPLSGAFGWLFNMMPGKMGVMLRDIAEKFIAGFGLLRTGRNYGIITIETAVLWCLYALQVFLILMSFNFMKIYPAIGATPILASFVILIVSAVGLSLPSAPGGVGTFHAACILGLSLFGVPAAPGASFALVIHAVTILFYIFWGIPFMLREGVALSELSKFKRNNND